LPTHLLAQTIECAGVGQCNYVNASEYAYIAGVPVSLLGLLLYGTLLVTAAGWYLRPASDLWPVSYWGVALSGALYAAYLTYVEVGVLKAVCVWCVASAVVLTVSFLLSSLGLLQPATARTAPRSS
jgi:uncharacterized membrane protein